MDAVARTRLAELEAVIDGGKPTFFEVGAALIEIRDHHLYEPDYRTFEDDASSVTASRSDTPDG